MDYVKKEDLIILETALQALETGVCRPETLSAFRQYVQHKQEERKAVLERTRKAMQRSRSTPEGKEKDKIRQKKANRNYYEKTKAKKDAEKAKEKEG